MMLSVATTLNHLGYNYFLLITPKIGTVNNIGVFCFIVSFEEQVAIVGVLGSGPVNRSQRQRLL